MAADGYHEGAQTERYMVPQSYDGKACRFDDGPGNMIATLGRSISPPKLLGLERAVA